MKKMFFVCFLFAALGSAGLVIADDNFGVVAPLLNPTTGPSTPTIASERTANGFVPVGPDSTLVPATVRGFEPGNGKDVSFGVVIPPTTPPKAN
jgi:hypothetical protein